MCIRDGYKAIDWAKMKADGITFAIIRIGDGGSNGKFFVDPWFKRNIQGARASGMKVGAVSYTHLDVYKRQRAGRSGRRMRYPSARWRPPRTRRPIGCWLGSQLGIGPVSYTHLVRLRLIDVHQRPPPLNRIRATQCAYWRQRPFFL